MFAYSHSSGGLERKPAVLEGGGSSPSASICLSCSCMCGNQVGLAAEPVIKSTACGRVAQWTERDGSNVLVAGSSPATPFFARIAQRIEQRTPNAQVGGSNPFAGTHGVCSSMVERLTVAQVAVGSNPIKHPSEVKNDNSQSRLSHHARFAKRCSCPTILSQLPLVLDTTPLMRLEKIGAISCTST